MQGEVEKALRKLHWQGKRILVAGRTDTGVHAYGQVIVFDLDWQHTEHDLRQAFNAYLPADIVARQVRQVNPRFDPRRHARTRCYQYRIFFQDLRDPLRERYAWRVWPPAEVKLLEETAAMLVGEHDFRAFGTPPRAGGTTVRRLYKASWQAFSDELLFEVVGNAFLYRMVRRMVASQVAVAQGKMSVMEMSSLIGLVDPTGYVQGLAPAHGLYLAKVEYPEQAMAF